MGNTGPNTLLNAGGTVHPHARGEYVITIGLFAVVLWLNYPTRGASAFLWAFGIGGLVLGYFIVSYIMFRR